MLVQLNGAFNSAKAAVGEVDAGDNDDENDEDSEIEVVEPPPRTSAAAPAPKVEVSLKFSIKVRASKKWIKKPQTFKVKNSLTMGKIIDAFQVALTEQHGRGVRVVSLNFDGDKIEREATAGDLELEEGDLIDATVEYA
jgi:hypothetical protein